MARCSLCSRTIFRTLPNPRGRQQRLPLRWILKSLDPTLNLISCYPLPTTSSRWLPRTLLWNFVDPPSSRWPITLASSPRSCRLERLFSSCFLFALFCFVLFCFFLPQWVHISLVPQPGRAQLIFRGGAANDLQKVPCRPLLHLLRHSEGQLVPRLPLLLQLYDASHEVSAAFLILFFFFFFLIP